MEESNDLFSEGVVYWDEDDILVYEQSPLDDPEYPWSE